MRQVKEILEFNKILKQLSELAISDKAKYTLLGLEMILDEKLCRAKMEETSEARKILDSMGQPPISSMQYMESIIDRVTIGTMLQPEELNLVTSFIKGCMYMKRYLARAEYLDCNLAEYGKGFFEHDELKELIELSIRGNTVDSEASSALKGVRRDIEIKREQIKLRLEKIMRAKKDYLAEQFILQRGERYVLAVRREYKSQVEGSVLDTSRSGGTVFIEPSAVSKLQEELRVLEIEEENEVRKVLYSLTNEVELYIQEMKLNMEMMEALDIAFAKGKLSAQLKASPVNLSTEGDLVIKNGRHPLLHQEQCVPLNFYMKDGKRGIIITGPNTGGKTVALKTVGLLSVMAQCGLHVPVEVGSQFRIFNEILCDIGDGQSIEESLSTFSSHIVNIIEILKRTTHQSLVLLDELGSGTDPAEGMGIAIATLEALRQKECLLVATTHYPEVKEYAKEAEGYINARMRFDKESLKPLYQLEIGEAGESCAFYIAEKLGFPKSLIQLASSYTYKQDREKILTSTQFNKDNQLQAPKNLSKQLEVELGKANDAPRIKATPKEKSVGTKKKDSFAIGDSVLIFPEKQKGIVFHTVDDKGKIGIQVKGAKRWVAVKRIKLLVAAKELYPEDYDFTIIFDTVSNRKAKKKIAKGKGEGVMATYSSEEEANYQVFQ